MVRGGGAAALRQAVGRDAGVEVRIIGARAGERLPFGGVGTHGDAVRRCTRSQATVVRAWARRVRFGSAAHARREGVGWAADARADFVGAWAGVSVIGVTGELTGDAV